MYSVYDIGFIDLEDNPDETELDVKFSLDQTAEMVELFNLIMSLKDELGIKEITYIDKVQIDKEED